VTWQQSIFALAGILLTGYGLFSYLPNIPLWLSSLSFAGAEKAKPADVELVKVISPVKLLIQASGLLAEEGRIEEAQAALALGAKCAKGSQ